MSLQKLKEHSFEEADVEQFAKLLNLMHEHVNGLDGKKAFEYFKLMSWAQQKMMPKIKAHVLGEPKIHESEEEQPKKAKAKK